MDNSENPDDNSRIGNAGAKKTRESVTFTHPLLVNKHSEPKNEVNNDV